MKKVSLKRRSVSQAKSISGIVGLTALAVLNVSKPADAVSFTCGPGEHWVETCPSGLDEFSNVATINVNVSTGPNSNLGFTSTISGQTKVLRGEPVDTVIGDPLLGNIGRMDGHRDVIKTELVNFTSTGASPFSPAITTIAGDGVPDLAPTPPNSIRPYKSLSSAGAILERPDNPALADSFLNLFLEIQGTPEGSLRNKEPITLQAVQPLTGFPPDRIDYVSTDISSLFGSGPDGIFWTGDESEVARLIPDDSGRAVVLTLTPVPEPSSGLSSVLGGLAIIFGFRRKQLAKRVYKILLQKLSGGAKSPVGTHKQVAHGKLS